MSDVIGRCHLCKAVGEIRFCPRCDHWFCRVCRNKYFWRGYSAVMERVTGKQPGCCGPEESV